MPDVDGAILCLCGDDGSAPEGVPPVVTNVVPTPGTSIGRGQVLSFDVTDNAGLRRVVVAAVFDSGAWEIIHDGNAFGPNYVLSSRGAISGGYHYTATRAAGWPRGTVRLRVYPIDTSGNEPT